MPTVPGLVPTERPSSQGAPESHINVSSDAFGGAVGHALSGLGNAVEGAGDKIFQRAMEMQNLQNETEAKTADAQYMMEAGKLHADFSALEGTQAKEAYPKYMEDLQSKRTEIRNGLSNQMAMKMYDGSSLSTMGRSIFNGAGHAAQQMKVASNNASTARVDQMINGIGATPNDEVTYDRHVAAIRSEVQSQGERNGWMPDQIKATAEAKISEATATRIAAMSKTDVFGAQRMLDTAVKAGTLRENDALKVQGTVQTQFRQVGSRMISDEVIKSRREGEDTRSEEELIAEGVAKAQKYAKDDPLFPDFVRDRIIADFRRQKSVERDGEQIARQTIESALVTGNKEGILPKSMDELKMIDPKVEAAWDHLKPDVQRRYQKVFADNASGEHVAWTDDSLRKYREIKGQAHDDPVEFLARDVVSEKMPSSAKRELINLQQRLQKQSESDPRVTRAMAILTPDLNAAGINKTDKEGYYQYIGALQDQLDQFQKDHKKTPNIKEVQEIGRQLMQEQKTGRRGWLVFTDESSPTYKLPVPEEESARLKADPYWARKGITPNDDMIARIYRAQKFKELYGGSAKPAQAAFPPNSPGGD